MLFQSSFKIRCTADINIGAIITLKNITMEHKHIIISKVQRVRGKLVFGVYQDLVGREDPRIQTVALPPTVYDEAAPKGISKRTSYLRVR